MLAGGSLLDRRDSPCAALITARVRPNKRLKLAGGDRFKGNGVLCPGRQELSFNDAARGGRVARTLSAIR